MSWRCRDSGSLPRSFYVFMDSSLRRPIVKLFFVAKQYMKQLDFFILKALFTTRNIVKTILASEQELHIWPCDSIISCLPRF